MEEEEEGDEEDKRPEMRISSNIYIACLSCIACALHLQAQDKRFLIFIITNIT